MASEQFIAFIEAIQANPILLEKLNNATDADTIVAIAKEAGFVITNEEVEDRLEQVLDEEEELTVEQLEAVAGGAVFCVTGAAIVGGGTLGGVLGWSAVKCSGTGT